MEVINTAFPSMQLILSIDNDSYTSQSLYVITLSQSISLKEFL